MGFITCMWIAYFFSIHYCTVDQKYHYFISLFYVFDYERKSVSDYLRKYAMII